MRQIFAYAPKAIKWALQRIYGFDRWHISSLAQRNYARDIVKFANGLSQRSSACEIGCGLGDIIRNLRFRNRTGYDIDAAVLRAARCLSLPFDRNITFGVFRFPEDSLTSANDLIIMVNWIHHIEPLLLQKMIAKYVSDNLVSGGTMIIDTVQDKAYEYNHDINMLTNQLNCVVTCVGRYEREREIWAIKKN